MNQQNEELNKLSKDFKIRNKIIDKLIFQLYGKSIKLHNKSEYWIWGKIIYLDKKKGFLNNIKARDCE